jgi:hypothetical protein
MDSFIDTQELAKRLVNARHKAGFTQREIEKKCGIPWHYLHALESNTNKLTTPTSRERVKVLAEHLNIKIPYLPAEKNGAHVDVEAPTPGIIETHVGIESDGQDYAKTEEAPDEVGADIEIDALRAICPQIERVDDPFARERIIAYLRSRYVSHPALKLACQGENPS